MNKARTTALDAALGPAIVKGMTNGGAIMGIAGVALGMALQAVGALPELTLPQMALFTLEVAAVGALFGAIREGVRARRSIGE